MAQLDLSTEEVGALLETLESALSELRYEINNTDAHDYKEKLREKKDALESVVGQLKNG